MQVSRTVIGKYLSICFLLLIATFGFDFAPKSAEPAGISSPATDSAGFSARSSGFSAHSARSSGFLALYDELQLGALDLSRDAFQRAIEGFLALRSAGRLGNPDVLSIVDFSLPSSKKRLFVLDLRNGRLLFNTLVAHGRNSGMLMATRFSNRFSSYMSSLGFYLTGQSFVGRHGYSLRLEGMEKGWNDHALQRAIVMHSASYVSEEHIRKWGFLGRSEGCPAIPQKMRTAIIDQIKGGSCLFLYGPDDRYLDREDPFS